MTNEHLAILYKDVFDLVYPQVENDNRGVLYKVIDILLEGEESKAYEICTYFGIKDDAWLEDDRDSINFLIPQPSLFLHPFNNGNFWQNFINPDNVINLNMVKVAWIVIVACVLVGAAVCIQYINKRKQKPRGNARTQQPDSSSSQITAALCLVVPASAIIELRNNHQNKLTDNILTPYDLKNLIDSASYFLCTSVENANSKEQLLEITNEDIPTNSKQEVYIRIHIDYGQEIINKKPAYILKRDLPSDGQRIVQRYCCLNGLSGLENFNRV